MSSIDEPVPAPEPAPVDDPVPTEEAVVKPPLPDGPEEATAEQVERDIDALDVLDATEKERDEYLDALRRLQADFENYKKRMQRQQAETLERAGEDLVSKLLPVLDTLDLAKQHGAGDGVEQIASALFDVLAKEGLERIDPVGAPFDPNEHEAVSHEPAGEGDEGEPVVSGLMRAGYRWKGRLVRAAMVTVRG
jgi:molecular chaperone GrpE